MVSSARNHPEKILTSTAGERPDYLMAGIYKLGALHQWPRQTIEAALVRNLGWSESKARMLVGHWITTLPYREAQS